MLGSILRIIQLCRLYDITEGRIEYGCDGDASIGIAQQVFEVTKTERKHFDLIKAIHDAIRRSTLT